MTSKHHSGGYMPRKPSSASKTSLYRLRIAPTEELVSGAKSDYVDRDEFTQKDVLIGDRQALIIYGQIPNESPDWLDHVQSLTSFRPSSRNDTSASLLLVRLTDSDEYCYGLSWGMGHLMVDGDRMDDGFGLRFALRRADSKQISALTAHALDTLPRTARLSVLGGTAISSFGLEEIGEVVSRIVGKIPADGFSSDRSDNPTFISIKGADALSVPLGREPGRALADLRLIDSTIRNEEPAEGLEHLENTKPLRPGHPRIEQLERVFSEHVADLTTIGRLALCWPAEWNEEVGEAASYRVTGLRSNNFLVADLELEDLIDPVAEMVDSDKLEKLRRIDVQGLSDDGGAISRKISADKWLAFECDLDSERYVMQRGRWYNVGGAYLRMLDEKIDRILATQSSVTLPPWPKQNKVRQRTGQSYVGRAVESAYNEWTATNSPDLLCMDRRMIRTEQHPSGFESCDLLTLDGSLIHIKHLDDSVSASHLFNQAIVSAEALRRQVDARDTFRIRVEELSKGTHVLPLDYRPSRVILAFSGGGAIAESIFTFSKIALARCAQRLGDLEIRLEIARLSESDDILPLG